MKRSTSALIAAIFGIVVLSASIAASYLQTPTPTTPGRSMLLGAPVTKTQKMERRRANVGIVAVAGVTAQ